VPIGLYVFDSFPLYETTPGAYEGVSGGNPGFPYRWHNLPGTYEWQIKANQTSGEPIEPYFYESPFFTIVVRSAQAPAPPESAPTPTQVALTLLGRPRVAAKGVTFAVSCQAPTGVTCNGEAALSHKGLKVGNTAFAVGAEQRKPVLVPINQTARRVLARRHELSVTLTVSFNNRVGGRPSIVASRGLRIIALKTGQLAREIQRAILTQRHLHATVRCPVVVIAKKGNDFTCIATVQIGKGKHETRVETIFAVTQQNDQGYVTWVGE
jgi:hypothetical protein